MTVALIDYGLGNLASVRCALEKCGAEVTLISDPQGLASADRIILPGVGAFTDGMHNLTQKGWIAPLKRRVLEEHVPMLGICLGMQLLAEYGYEGEKTKGLGLLRGDVIRLEPTAAKERIPHAGWNDITRRQDTPLLEGIADGTDFYFIHSYHVKAADPQDIAAVTSYCGEFVSAVARGNIFGVQFHPEKSHRFGARLLKNFLEIAC